MRAEQANPLGGLRVLSIQRPLIYRRPFGIASQYEPRLDVGPTRPGIEAIGRKSGFGPVPWAQNEPMILSCYASAAGRIMDWRGSRPAEWNRVSLNRI